MSNIEVKQIKSNDEWDTFVINSPQYTIFSSSKWASLIGKTTNFKHVFYGCFKGHEMIAGLLIFYMRKGPFKLAQYPPLTPYVTPLYSERNTTKIFKIETYETNITNNLINQIKEDFHYFALSLHYSLKDFRPFQANGLKPQMAYTYFLDLRDINKLWENLSKDTKYSINKSKDKGTVVYQSKDANKFFELYRKTCEYQKIPLLVNNALIQEILGLKSSLLLVAKNNHGKDIAANICIFDEKKSYYLMAAQDNAYRENNAPSLLLWEAIRYASKKREIMDLVGANTPSVAKFKSSFNPKLVPYISIEYFPSLLAKIVINLYKLIQH